MTKMKIFYNSWDNTVTVTKRVPLVAEVAARLPRPVFPDYSNQNSFPKDIWQDFKKSLSVETQIEDTLLYKRIENGRVLFRKAHSIAILIDADGDAGDLIAVPQTGRYSERNPHKEEQLLIDWLLHLMSNKYKGTPRQ